MILKKTIKIQLSHIISKRNENRRCGINVRFSGVTLTNISSTVRALIFFWLNYLTIKFHSAVAHFFMVHLSNHKIPQCCYRRPHPPPYKRPSLGGPFMRGVIVGWVPPSLPPLHKRPLPHNRFEIPLPLCQSHF